MAIFTFWKRTAKIKLLTYFSKGGPIVYKDVPYNQFAQDALQQLPKGAFLTVQHGDEKNTMTIGWGSIGFVWQKPIFMVAVRYSRHTYGILEKAKEFTVSFPIKEDLSRELALCGTKSGRDLDKFAAAGITTRPGQVVKTPIIDECSLHYECKVVYQQVMEPGTLSPEIRTRAYGKDDYHVLYYGKLSPATPKSSRERQPCNSLPLPMGYDKMFFASRRMEYPVWTTSRHLKELLACCFAVKFVLFPLPWLPGTQLGLQQRQHSETQLCWPWGWSETHRWPQLFLRKSPSTHFPQQIPMSPVDAMCRGSPCRLRLANRLYRPLF
jgi:flavin reductase (DIM6/NTAB) family NADH-FMN oxidoreductase RutF